MADIYELTLIAIILLSAMLCLLHLAYREDKTELHVGGYTIARNEYGLWELYVGSPSGFYYAHTGYEFKRRIVAIQWALNNPIYDENA